MTHWKLLLLPLAVLLPLLAYVVGTLSTGPEGPTPPQPVILRDDDSGSDPGSREKRPQRDGPQDVRRGEDVRRGDDGRGDDDDDRNEDNGQDRDDEDDDDEPEVVLPSPTELDEDEADDDDGGVEGDDGGDD